MRKTRSRAAPADEVSAHPEPDTAGFSRDRIAGERRTRGWYARRREDVALLKELTGHPNPNLAVAARDAALEIEAFAKESTP